MIVMVKVRGINSCIRLCVCVCTKNQILIYFLSCVKIETIAQTLNSLIPVLKQQRWIREQLSAPQLGRLSGSFKAQAEQ